MLRLAILDRVRQLPIGFHLSRLRADTPGALTTDIQTFQMLMAEALPRLGQILGLPVVLFAWLLWTDWLVGVAALLPIAIAVPMLARIHRFLAALSLQRSDLQATAGSRMCVSAGSSTRRAFRKAPVREGHKDSTSASRT